MLFGMRGIAISAGLVALASISAGSALAFQPEASEAIFKKQTPIADALKIKLSSKFKKRGSNAKNRGALAAFYAERKYAPMWISNGRLNTKALAVKQELANAAIYGLNPADYQTPDAAAALRTGSADTDSDSTPAIDAKSMAQIELQMSQAALIYIRHANEGRFDQTKLSRFLDRKAKPIDTVAKLTELANAGDATAFLKGQHPNHPQFKALMKALGEANVPKLFGERIRIPRGPVLKPGMKHAQVALVRRRLGVEAAEGADPRLYDDVLKQAVSAYQKENNLRSEGYVGLKTRFAMNAPKRDRHSQILANMERWRWMPRDLGDRHVRVNIPEYKVRVMHNGQAIHEERVIVGKTRNKTPTFSDQMETVVFNPYWNIPQSIIWNEMNGRIPSGYEGGVRNGRMWIRQPPGPRNALGRVKFLFPNKHAVYMHDTPNKSLFNKQRRAFSHGCMRVRDPKRLAEVVLGMDGWSNSKVRRQFKTLRNNQVPLKRKVPVHVTYFTLWADEDGKLASFSDIYGHDNRIHAAISKGVDYAKRKFPEVRKQKIQVSQAALNGERGNGYDDWFFPPSTSNAYWGGHSRKKAKRTRVYHKKRKKQNYQPFGEFLSNF